MGLLLRADARALPLRTASVHCAVTSPPYLGQREYGDRADELGRSTIAAYIDEMLAATAEVWRVLRDDGVLWLNIADTAVGSGGAGGDYNAGGRKDGKRRYRQAKLELAPMQWANVPARLAIAVQDQGWLLRSTVIWCKPGRRPEDLRHVRRPGISHEYVFMLTKGRHYRFFPDRLPEGGSVWHFRTSRRGGHPAAFPLELPRRCIAASTEVGDTVLDPFSGQGTTVEAAELMGRHGVGVDLYAQRPADAALPA